MPTGYTADVSNGTTTSLRSFAIRCARAFGALAHMRDFPIDTPIDVQRNGYDAELREAEAHLEMMREVSDKWIESSIERRHLEALEFEERYHRNVTVVRARYEAMLEKVTAWDAPPQLRDLREFMLKQIRESIEWDCPPPRPVRIHERPTVAAFRAKEIAAAEERLAAARVRHAEEEKRLSASRKWVADLLAALPND